MSSIEIYTDGSCNPNPGKGGWAFISIEPEREVRLSGNSGKIKTTNNRMELIAIIEALNFYFEEETLVIHSDSQYSLKCISGEYKRKANLDLWREFDKALRGRSITWVKVKAHSGNIYNEKVDKLAKSEIGL